ncbi:NAP1-related protein 2-like isoform X2 [Magnolia sinica]|uniref:NAP1-related protein 2-like isoform X2 n=1 Tax=Magnolia sinica TaxID=86752 RepID=UPI0026582DB8|nr:NAP1-related protein 2-like isoform X2 [Magnolia sinica]
MVGENGKKSKLEYEGSVPEQQIVDGDLLVSMEKVQEFQDELEKVNEEVADKVLEVERKYNEIRQPIYDRRNEVIQTIPDFWLTAFLSHPTLCGLMTEEDPKIFKYMKSLEVFDLNDVKLGYSITFNFRPNPYFENAKLVKTFSVDTEGCCNFTGTDIKWKDGRGTSNGTAQEKEGNKRPFAEESFFTWFSEAPFEELSVARHDEVANIIREDLWTNPLQYFNIEGYELDDDDDDDDEDDEDENGENDDDEEEDEEEDDES